MTLFEWKITDLGDGQFGHIWIAKPSADATRNCIRVYVDPCNVDGDASYWLEHDPHVLFNCEWEDDSEGSDGRILTYWRSIGSPVADRNSVDYEAPWFPWAEAGFTTQERDDCLRISQHRDHKFEHTAVGKVSTRIDVDEDIKTVLFGDPEAAGGNLRLADGVRLGEFYVHPEGEDVIYNSCPLCGCDSAIYGGNRWYTQACCYSHVREEDVSLSIERWVTGHLLAGETIDGVHARLAALRTDPPLRSYIERIHAILNDQRTAAAYKKYLSQDDHPRSDPDWGHEMAARAIEEMQE